MKPQEQTYSKSRRLKNQIKAVVTNPYNIIVLIAVVLLVYLIVLPLLDMIATTFELAQRDIRAVGGGKAGDFTLYYWQRLLASELSWTMLIKPLINSLVIGVCVSVCAILLGSILAHPAKPCQHIRYIPISPLIQHFQADQLRPRRHTLIASRRRRAAAGNHPCHMRSMPIVIIRLLFFLKEIPKSVNAIFQIRMQKYPCVQDRHPDAFSCQSSSVRLIAMNPFSRPVHRKKPPYSSLTVRIWGLSPYVNAASYLWKL